VASIINLVVYTEIAHAGVPPRTDNVDPLRTPPSLHFLQATIDHLLEASTLSLFWAYLEAGIGLIAACLPTLSFLVTYVKRRVKGRSTGSVFSVRSLDSTQHVTRSQQPVPLSQHSYRSAPVIESSSSTCECDWGFDDPALPHRPAPCK
jgi:hypothetical protein